MTAPQRDYPYRPQQRPVKPHLVPEKKHSRAERVAHAAAVSRRAARIMLISLTAFVMLAMLIVQRAKIATLDMQIIEAQTQLEEVKSETVRLESLFNSMASVESVEEYATNKLGMVKRTRNQVSFFVNENSDEIILESAIGAQ